LTYRGGAAPQSPKSLPTSLHRSPTSSREQQNANTCNRQRKKVQHPAAHHSRSEICFMHAAWRRVNAEYPSCEPRCGGALLSAVWTPTHSLSESACTCNRRRKKFRTLTGDHRRSEICLCLLQAAVVNAAYLHACSVSFLFGTNHTTLRPNSWGTILMARRHLHRNCGVRTKSFYIPDENHS
jgi:hypothetical protein